MKHLILGTTLCILMNTGQAAAPIQPVVEVEETVYEYVPPENGAGPMWCFGSPTLVRYGNEVFVTGQETDTERKPLNNTRWTLWQRTKDGWQLLQRDPKDLQREPCPLGLLSGGRLVLSTNPALTPLDVYDGPANPHVLDFDAKNPRAAGTPSQPVWTKNPGFREHSYRGLGVDGPRGEVALFNNYMYDEQHWSFRSQDGKWINNGIINYPIRGCYESIALRDRDCHVFAIGDVTEPNQEWKQWKFEQSGGKAWDYVFRRLYYVHNPDIAKQQFLPPIEVENVDATAGYLQNHDLWIDKEGAAHVLYRKQNIATAAFRDKFFPGTPLNISLEYCVIKDNKVVRRQTLISHPEGPTAPIPGWSRFHSTPDGRLFVVYYCSGVEGEKRISENRIMELRPDGTLGPSITIPLKQPFKMYMTATERGGSKPSNTLDLFGDYPAPSEGKAAMGYARIRLLP